MYSPLFSRVVPVKHSLSLIIYYIIQFIATQKLIDKLSLLLSHAVLRLFRHFRLSKYWNNTDFDFSTEKKVSFLLSNIIKLLDANNQLKLQNCGVEAHPFTIKFVF